MSLLLRGAIALALGASAWGQVSGHFVTVLPSGGNVGELRLIAPDNTHYVGWKSPNSVATSFSWRLPAADAANAMCSDGSGNLSFTCNTITATTLLGNAVGTLSLRVDQASLTSPTDFFTWNIPTTHILDLRNSSNTLVLELQDFGAGAQPILLAGQLVPLALAGTNTVGTGVNRWQGMYTTFFDASSSITGDSYILNTTNWGISSGGTGAYGHVVVTRDSAATITRVNILAGGVSTGGSVETYDSLGTTVINTLDQSGYSIGGNNVITLSSGVAVGIFGNGGVSVTALSSSAANATAFATSNSSASLATFTANNTGGGPAYEVVSGTLKIDPLIGVGSRALCVTSAGVVYSALSTTCP